MAQRFLDIKNLQGWYGESHVLHGVNLHVLDFEKTLGCRHQWAPTSSVCALPM